MNDFINNINLMYKNWIPSQSWEAELRQNEQKDKALQNKYWQFPDRQPAGYQSAMKRYCVSTRF